MILADAVSSFRKHACDGRLRLKEPVALKKSVMLVLESDAKSIRR
jgi:hypothetical protein